MLLGQNQAADRMLKGWDLISPEVSKNLTLQWLRIGFVGRFSAHEFVVKLVSISELEFVFLLIENPVQIDIRLEGSVWEQTAVGYPDGLNRVPDLESFGIAVCIVGRTVGDKCEPYVLISLSGYIKGIGHGVRSSFLLILFGSIHPAFDVCERHEHVYAQHIQVSVGAGCESTDVAVRKHGRE